MTRIALRLEPDDFATISARHVGLYTFATSALATRGPPG